MRFSLNRCCGYHRRITGKDARSEVTYEGGWQNNRKYVMGKIRHPSHLDGLSVALD